MFCENFIFPKRIFKNRNTFLKGMVCRVETGGKCIWFFLFYLTAEVSKNRSGKAHPIERFLNNYDYCMNLKNKYWISCRSRYMRHVLLGSNALTLKMLLL